MSMPEAWLQREVTGNDDVAEDSLAASYVDQVSRGLPIDPRERDYLARKLDAIAHLDDGEYIPAQLRHMTDLERFRLRRALDAA